MKYWPTVFLFMIIAQATAQKITRNWYAAIPLDEGVARTGFNISQDKEKYTGYFVSPDLGIKGLFFDSIELNDQQVFIKFASQLFFKGVFTKDSLLVGYFTFGGQVKRVNFKRVDKLPNFEKPQTPQPPFPYTSQLVFFKDNTTGLRYAGTLTYPKQANEEKKYPAILLLAGSEPNTRDVNLGAHKFFAVIADYFTKNDYVVLRTDDRGIGGSTGDFKNTTLPDFKNDAHAALKFLKTQPFVDTTMIGILGHSEGGMVGPLVANENSSVKFLILLAAPAVPFKELVLQQIMDAFGKYLPPATAKNISSIYKEEFLKINNTIDTAQFLTNFRNRINNLEDENGKKIVSTAEDAKYVDKMVDVVKNRWFTSRVHFLYDYNPAPAISSLKIPVLALYGSKDILVNAAKNSLSMKSALTQSRIKKFAVYNLPGLNHQFQVCYKCTLFEPQYLDETISPFVLALMGEWLKNGYQIKSPAFSTFLKSQKK